MHVALPSPHSPIAACAAAAPGSYIALSSLSSFKTESTSLVISQVLHWPETQPIAPWSIAHCESPHCNHQICVAMLICLPVQTFESFMTAGQKELLGVV